MNDQDHPDPNHYRPSSPESPYADPPGPRPPHWHPSHPGPSDWSPQPGQQIYDPSNGAPPGKTRPRRLRRLLSWAVAVTVIGPLVAFTLGWMLFEIPPPESAFDMQVATIDYADGTPLAVVRPEGGQNRQKITLDQVPQLVRYAVMSAEDRSFLSNPGFDPMGIVRAAISQLTGGVGGGSTITQQYIKITTGQDQDSVFRKYKEIVLAAKMSKSHTKDQILEDYLNAIYFGRGAYGIQAAAQAYFGVNAPQLTASQGALLAGLIQSPSRWDPAQNPAKATERWNYVLDGEVAQRWMSPAERATQRFPAWITPKPAAGGIPADATGHIYTQVKAELASKGITEQELNQEGLKITTTIDPVLQKLASDTAAKVLRGQPSNLRSALISIDPHTGAILAYYGGNNGVGLDYAQVLKQPGSSFKPFVMTAALEQNPPIGLGTLYDGSSPQTILGQVVSNSDGDSCDRCDLKTAMTQSINTVFYQLAAQVGASRVAQAAHQAGIPADLLPTPTAGIALGDKEVHPADMASAYATFATDGIYHAPHMVTEVETSDGRVLYQQGAEPGEQRIDPQIARNVTESMLDVASSSRIPLSNGRPVAAKTGTTQSSRVPGQNNDAWTVGYTPSYSTAVWVGTDNNSPIRTATGRIIYGRMLPGSMWQQFMDGALRGKPVELFSPLVPLGTPAGYGAPSASMDPDDPDSSESPDSDRADSDNSDSDGSDSDKSDSEKKKKKHKRNDSDECDYIQCDANGNPSGGSRNSNDTNNSFTSGGTTGTSGN